MESMETQKKLLKRDILIRKNKPIYERFKLIMKITKMLNNVKYLLLNNKFKILNY